MLRSEVLVSSVIMNVNVFWDVMMYSPTDHYQHFGGPCFCFQFQGRRVASTMKMEAARSSKMLASLLHIITPQKLVTFIVGCCENQKSHAIRTTLKNCLYWCTINSTWYISLPNRKSSSHFDGLSGSINMQLSIHTKQRTVLHLHFFVSHSSAY